MAVRAIPVLAILGCFACNRDPGLPPPLAVDQIPAEFQKAFGTAQSEIKDLALQVSSAVQTNDYSAAFASVQALCNASGTTKEQSLLAARAMLAINGLLQTAQSKGDEQAAETLKVYQRTK
jgi:hypothetical protein